VDPKPQHDEHVPENEERERRPAYEKPVLRECGRLEPSLQLGSPPGPPGFFPKP